MDFDNFIQIAGAVVFGNIAFAVTAIAIYKAEKLQREKRLSDTELPFWIYPCGIVAPALVAWAAYLSSH